MLDPSSPDRDTMLDGDDPIESNELQESRQFSLLGLLTVFTLVAVLLGFATWLPLRWFAGLVGLAVFVGLALISLFDCRSAIVHVAWWTVALLYIAASVAAALDS